MRFSVAASAFFAAYAAALSITSPKKGEDVDLTQDVKIEWSAVNTDPSTFDIYLVNMNVYPNVNQLVASNVKASDGSYTFKGTTGITTGGGYQVNFLSTDPQNTGILAQSQQFDVTKASSSSSSTESASSASETSTSEATSSGTSTIVLTIASSSTTSPSSTDSTTTTTSDSSSSSSSPSPSSSSFVTSASTATATGSSSSVTGSTTASPTVSGSADASHTAPIQTTNAAVALGAPATAGGLLMGLFALVL